jgi:hypothetical protein
VALLHLQSHLRVGRVEVSGDAGEDGSQINGSHDVVRVHRSGSIIGHNEGGDSAEGRGTSATIEGEHRQGAVRRYLVETVPRT